MEYSRYDWARQELEAIKFDLYRLNHLRDYVPSMQFFVNEINAINEIQAELLNRAPLTSEVQEKVYWLAAQIEWTRKCTTYGDKLLCTSAMTASVCNVMGGKRSSWMAAAPSWEIYS